LKALLEPTKLEEQIHETEEKMTPKTAAQPVPMATMGEIVAAAGVVVALYGGIIFGLVKLAKLIHGAT
jgi:hypothetical protein